jgi:hypothetical protein
MLELWRSLMQSLGIQQGSQHVAPTRGAPVLSGVVEKMRDGAYPELLLRLDQPAPGLAHMFPMPICLSMIRSIHLYIYTAIQVQQSQQKSNVTGPSGSPSSFWQPQTRKNRGEAVALSAIFSKLLRRKSSNLANRLFRSGRRDLIFKRVGATGHHSSFFISL